MLHCSTLLKAKPNGIKSKAGQLSTTATKLQLPYIVLVCMGY